MSEEEKAAKKLQRAAEKQAEQKKKLATASAAKYLPALKGALQKLTDKKDRMGEVYAQVPVATQEQVAEAVQDLTSTVSFATKLLDAAAKGTAFKEDVPWNKEKDLQGKVKAGNEALRAIADVLRAGKPASKGQGRGGQKK
eukprot:s3474_g7.t1